MSEDLEEHVEILVHSAAPTSKRGDDRIRAQALAILSFIPEKRTHITSLTFPRKRLRQHEEWHSSPPNLHGTQEGKYRDEESQLETSSWGSEELLDHSVEYSTDEPCMMLGLLPQLTDPEISHITQVASSQNLPTLDESEPDSSYATTRFDSWESPPASIPDSQLVCDTFVPSTAPPDTEGSPNEVFPAVSSVSFCYNQPPPTARSLAPLSSQLESPLSFSDYSLDSLHSRHTPPSALLPERGLTSALKTLIDKPHELISPAPDTDSKPPLVTSQLREMTEVGDLLVGKYQKLKRFQARELREWERGHWRVDMSSWESPKKKVNFWNILKDNVENGRLGPVNAFLDDETGDIVKVYCHGGMAEHLWCALFVMSSRNSKDATWIDAGDSEIIMF